MSVIEELSKLFEKYDLEVKARKRSITGTHSELPVSLVVKIVSDKKAVVELKAEEELSDAIYDLVESEENVEEIVDDVLSELQDLAVNVSRILEKKGYQVKLNLREGENDVREALEEVIEEYREFEEE